MTLTAETAPTPPAPAPIATVIELAAVQIAQHPENLRDATRGIRELAASIAEVGVLVPLIVVPVAAVPGHEFDAGITHVAVDGNRRQLAARQAGLPVPCIVRPDLASAREHALTMAVTGLTRDGLTVREEAHAVQAMLDLGIEASAIARATGRTRKQVSTARKAARLSDDLAHATVDHDLTLTDLAALTEWQHDPEAVELLTDAIGRGQLAHTLARLDLTRRERQITARTVRELTAAGVKCIDQRPHWSGTPCELDGLRAADSPPGQQFTPDAHAQCPGHVAHVEVTIYPADDEDDEHVEVAITYGCANPAAYGHPTRWAAITTSPPADDNDGDADDELTHAERATQAQRRQEEAAARAEAARRQERSDLIRRNKEAPVDCTSVGAFVGLGAGRRRTLCWEVVPWIRCPLRAMSRCSVFQRSAGSTGLAGVRGRCWARTASRCWRGQVSGASWWPAGVPPRRAVPMPTTFCGGCVSLPRWALRGSRPAGSRCATTCGGCALRPIRPATGAQRRVAGHRPGR